MLKEGAVTAVTAPFCMPGNTPGITPKPVCRATDRFQSGGHTLIVFCRYLSHSPGRDHDSDFSSANEEDA